MAAIDILKGLKKDFLLADPLTDFDELQSNMDDCMKSRMELTVMYIQACVCKRLQQFEGEKSFKIDRWLRKEGGGGITCIIQDGDY